MLRHAALKAPPKVVDTIFEWARGEVSSHLLAIATARRDKNLAQTKDKTMSKALRKQFEEKAAASEKLLHAVRQYTRAPADSTMPSFTTFHLDLTGWPYKVPARAALPTDVMALVVYDHPSVRFGAAQFMEGEPGRPSIGSITLYASQKGLEDVWVVDDLHKAFARIETSIEHEAQHLAQALLRRISGNPFAGNPIPGESGDYDPFKDPEKYHLDPHEFWPMVDSIAREIHLKLRGVSEVIRPDRLHHLVDEQPMLRTLAKKAPALWAKAVREIAKKLGPEGLTLRVAARFVSEG